MAELTVIVTYFNPCRYQTRKHNFIRFVKYLRLTTQAELLTIECAFGDAEFEIDSDIRVRAEHPLWVKENLINIGLKQVTTPYVAWFDGDIIFKDRDWVSKTIDALQRKPLIQPWQKAVCMSASGTPLLAKQSFCYMYEKTHMVEWQSGSGYAWAARKEILDQTDGLLETMVVGGADHMMALAIFGEEPMFYAHHDYSLPFREAIANWSEKFAKIVNQEIGYAPTTIHHLFHGSRVNRKYSSRHKIPLKFHFNPDIHLQKNSDGVLQLVNQPEMQLQIIDYFQSRLEDGK